MINLPFDLFLAAHIVTGAVGAIAFWVPVVARKGGQAHRRGGEIFYRCMVATGLFAMGMSITTLVATPAVHHGLTDTALVRGLFGWMMLYLAILTISLAWHGMLVVRSKLAHDGNREPVNVGLQVATIVSALNCAWQGWQIGQVLMLGIAVVGVASGITNLVFVYGPRPSRASYLKEHVKALVGAGISVYTAFMAFGSVRLMPSLALNPLMWAIPLTIGVGLIVYHQWRIDRGARERVTAHTRPAG